jgi:hypothetical protein
MPPDMTGYDKSDKFLLNGNQLEEMIWNWRNGRENGTWKVGEVDTYVGGKVGKQAAIGMMQTWTMQKERWIALNRNQRKEVTEKNFSPALWDRCCRVFMPIRYLATLWGVLSWSWKLRLSSCCYKASPYSFVETLECMD